MTIAGLAREGGVGVETIRYYQRRGLLAQPPRTAGSGVAGGIRRYDAEAVRQLKFVRSAQAAGFTLEEVSELLKLDATDNRSKARAMARSRIAALDRKIHELETAKVWLTRLADECGASDVGRCPILRAFEAS
ncbi:MerR family transcriptional regulator [Sphingomonas sp. CROZ-RG-20F-R02-07]|uniref:MerR family transcriptional regulator n=1 Tax=Sphingomonas sp. CROZ-RG-20F-R02-07 TaxID=2914832 RepID=UPI001F58D654|nr:MerR family transcriptional regulator [Sphingomonas sp. CROZ-RG-20F-R02-07]